VVDLWYYESHCPACGRDGHVEPFDLDFRDRLTPPVEEGFDPPALQCRRCGQCWDNPSHIDRDERSIEDQLIEDGFACEPLILPEFKLASQIATDYILGPQRVARVTKWRYEDGHETFSYGLYEGFPLHVRGAGILPEITTVEEALRAALMGILPEITTVEEALRATLMRHGFQVPEELPAPLPVLDVKSPPLLPSPLERLDSRLAAAINALQAACMPDGFPPRQLVKSIYEPALRELLQACSLVLMR